MNTSRYKIDPEGSNCPTTPISETTIETGRPAEPGEIPVIDLTALYGDDPATRLSTAEELGAACERIGFFYIINHRVEQSIIDEAFRAAVQFFDQPDSFKRSLAFNHCQRGYKEPGNVTIPGHPPDLKEVFDLGIDLPADHPDVVAGKPLHGPNQWPELDGFRDTLMRYYNAVSQTGYDLLRLFALALELDEMFFQPFHQNPFITWRIMRYPPREQTPGQFGTAPHTDFGTLTLLAQDDKGGLEVYTRDGEWIQAPFIPGSFVVNIGDLMACWTNDRFTSTAHRVINESGTDRYSIPMFYNPAFDTVAECLPTCQSKSNPAKYEPIHYGSYLTGIYSRIFSRN